MTKIMVVLMRAIQVCRSGRLPRAHPTEALTRSIGWSGRRQGIVCKEYDSGACAQ